MSKTEYDYLIVGHGMAGAILSYLLMNEGKKILVIDEFNTGASSQVAAGIVNPVTGRRVVKTWMADTLLPFALNFYQSCEENFGFRFYHPTDVLEVLHSVKEINEWTSRMGEPGMKHYSTKSAPEELFTGKVSEFKKMFRINSSAWMDMPLFIKLCRQRLADSDSILEERFDHSKLLVKESSIEYGIYKSEKIIFCEGNRLSENPFWKTLPLQPAKGEILTIECKGLPDEYIILSGFFIVPIGNSKFRVGATYEWKYPDELPTDEGKQKLIDLLDNFLKLSYKIIDHRAGVRPTVKDRRPFIGNHPDHKHVLIFNGMGTKGVLLIPYFADHFVKYLNGNEKLMPEVDVQRFLG